MKAISILLLLLFTGCASVAEPDPVVMIDHSAWTSVGWKVLFFSDGSYQQEVHERLPGMWSCKYTGRLSGPQLATIRGIVDELENSPEDVGPPPDPGGTIRIPTDELVVLIEVLVTPTRKIRVFSPESATASPAVDLIQYAQAVLPFPKLKKDHSSPCR